MNSNDDFYFELPVMHYLNQWISIEKPIHEGLQSKDADQRLGFLRKATGFFRVARNLKKVHENENQRLKPLLEILDDVKFDESDTTRAVAQLQENIAAIYKIQALSLSTKMLWMKFRYPYVIYDSQARAAVDSLPGDYGDFISKWQSDFKQCETQIVETCGRLKGALTLPEAHEVLGERWFHQRVFDIHLWNKGKK